MSDKEPSQRQLRVGEQIRHALSRILARGELRDPALTNVPITVSEVRCSPDLKTATAYVLPLGGENVGEVISALKRAGAFLRGQVAREIRLKYTPGLRFMADESFDEANRIDSLLRRPEVVRDLRPGAANDPQDDDYDGDNYDGDNYDGDDSARSARED